MKKYIRKITTAPFVLGLMVCLFSCQTDLLEPTPKTTYSDKVVFDSPSRVLQQVNGLYKAVKSGQFLGGRYFVYNDIRGEEFINRLTNGVTGLETWNFSGTESNNEVNNLWNAAYAAINQINVFLEGMEANAGKFAPPTFPADFATTAEQYKAEARFLRGLAYFYLQQLYARPYQDGNGSKPGLPLRLTAQKDATNNDLARSTTAEVYAQILADLNFAEQNLPANYSTDLLNTTRAHRNTAIAIKTRVYLVMGQYADVITEANKIVTATAPFTAPSGVAHALQASFSSVFSGAQTTKESILSMPFSTNDAPGTQNQLGYYYLPSSGGGNGEYYLNSGATGILNNTSWKTGDSRKAMTVVASGQTYLTKFSGPSPYTDKVPVMRYSEVLLNLAEARARVNGLDPQAIALVNAVRRRSDNTTTIAPATAAELINAILLERRIEFLGEGLRSIDLLRLQQTIPAKGTVGAVAPSDIKYIWPIPSGELNANLLMTRNE
ncbi:MAG TPA: RagB/SusD family nutrient uptake outer membrane protein [Chryseosolibacter sp.]